MKTIEPRTSISHPLQIAEIQPVPGMGLAGLTFCPGKQQSWGLTGSWSRDLDLDVDAVAAWNAAVVLTLVEPAELERLKVDGLGDAVRARHMEWLHLPIRDRGVPDATFEAAWQVAGEGLRNRLRAGFNILVHCMGGLGRAGTIVSRLLVELGWNAEEAIHAVREVRPGALETEAQVNSVHGCTLIPEEQPGTAIDAIRDRAMGALLGLAVGDALGTTLEFAPRDSRPRVTDMVGGGPFLLEPGQWTDDTSMALALADSLLAHDGLDEHDLMSRFVRWMDEGAYSSNGLCFDIGATVGGALNRFKATGDPIAGSGDPLSAGNGSLMRLAPVAIRYWDDAEKRRDIAARQSRTTHGADEAVDACVAFADMLADAISGKLKSIVREHHTRREYAGRIAAIMAGSWRGKARNEIKSSGYVAHSLEAAIWCVARTSNFADAVVLAANLGDDADTVAAITGQLAGAVHGCRAIPSDWLQALTTHDTIRDLGGRLFDRRGG